MSVDLFKHLDQAWQLHRDCKSEQEEGKRDKERKEHGNLNRRETILCGLGLGYHEKYEKSKGNA